MAVQTSGGSAVPAAASLTASTAGVVVWAVNRYLFGGDIPPEVHGWLLLAVPAALGHAAGLWSLRRARDRQAAAENATFAGLILPSEPRRTEG